MWQVARYRCIFWHQSLATPEKRFNFYNQCPNRHDGRQLGCVDGFFFKYEAFELNFKVETVVYTIQSICVYT